MKTITNYWQFLFAGLYTWVVTISFGAVLLDMVYANLASSALQSSETGPIYSKVADFLLVIVALTVLASIGAIGSSWLVASARNAFIASVLCVLLPLLAYSLIEMAQVNLGLNIGLWVRLSTSALSSILAFTGLAKLCFSSGSQTAKR